MLAELAKTAPTLIGCFKPKNIKNVLYVFETLAVAKIQQDFSMQLQRVRFKLVKQSYRIFLKINYYLFKSSEKVL